MAAMEIESPANPRIRAAAALRERRERDRSGLTLVDGLRESIRALEAGVATELALLCPTLLENDAEGRRDGDGDGDEASGSADGSGRLRALLRERGTETVDVSERAFSRIAFGDRNDGIVLVVRAPTTDLAAIRFADGEDPLVVVTEDIEKPGNLGAILRSADGAGANAVVAVGGTDLFNPNVIRASTGTVFSVPIAAAPAAAVLHWLREHGLRIVAAKVNAARLHTEADLTGPLAIVLGNEASGLSEAWNAPDVESLRLPMRGVADSLNVSVAGAVLLYEARRQRDGQQR
jgi:TrmH family RNA methyltransferase